jgi:hypothetical protein
LPAGWSKRVCHWAISAYNPAAQWRANFRSPGWQTQAANGGFAAVISAPPTPAFGRFLPDALGDPSRSKNAVCKAAMIKCEAEANAFIALAQAEEATI